MRARRGDEPLPGGCCARARCCRSCVSPGTRRTRSGTTRSSRSAKLQQRWLLRRLNIEDADWEHLGIGAGAGAGRHSSPRCRRTWRGVPAARRRDPLAQIYDQLCRKLARARAAARCARRSERLRRSRQCRRGPSSRGSSRKFASCMSACATVRARGRRSPLRAEPAEVPREPVESLTPRPHCDRLADNVEVSRAAAPLSWRSPSGIAVWFVRPSLAGVAAGARARAAAVSGALARLAARHACRSTRASRRTCAARCRD